MSTKVIVSIPTFEPEYDGNPQVETFYTTNFESFLDPEGPFSVELILSDFRSSDPFKAFLRRLADRHPGKIYVIDGQAKAGGPHAVNMGFRLRPYDIAVYAASDCRARDRQWLGQLVRDFEDPKVFASYATSGFESSHLVEQLQAEAIERPSRHLVFPESAIPNVVAYRRQLLEPFGHRWSDFNYLDPLSGLAWQLEAVDGVATVNFRCNILHEHFFDEGRYNRHKSSHWHADRTEQDRLKRAVFYYLPIPISMLNPRHTVPPIIAPLIEGWREQGLRGLARAAYIRGRRSQIMYVWWQIKLWGFWGYLGQHWRVKRRLRAFHQMDQTRRCALVNALYFENEIFYDQLSYSVYPEIKS